MRKVNYFKRNGFSLSELNLKARLLMQFVERDMEALAQVGYSSEMLAAFKTAADQFWAASDDMIDRTKISSEIENRERMSALLVRKLRVAIIAFRSVYPEGNTFTRVFERTAISDLSNAELATLSKNVLQFIALYADDFSSHSVITGEFINDLNALTEEFTWAILSARVQQSMRISNTYARHILAEELFKQMQLVSMFGKVAFSFDEPMKYNDYILESATGSSPQEPYDEAETDELTETDDENPDDELASGELSETTQS